MSVVKISRFRHSSLSFPLKWIDRVHARHPPKAVVLDMDSMVIRLTHGDPERSRLRPGNVHSADGRCGNEAAAAAGFPPEDQRGTAAKLTAKARAKVVNNSEDARWGYIKEVSAASEAVALIASLFGVSAGRPRPCRARDARAHPLSDAA